MGAIADLAVPAGGQIAATPAPEVNMTPVDGRQIASPLQNGFRSGLNVLSGNLNALAGQTGEALGLKEFADDRFKAAAEYTAAAESPGIKDWSEVKDFTTLTHYVGNLIGQSTATTLPAIGLGIGLRRPVAGVMAGIAPVEAGGQVQDLRADPKVMAATTPGQRLVNAAGVGVANAAMDATVGGEGQMVRRALGKAPRDGFVKSVAKGIVGEGTTEPAQNLVGQLAHQKLNPEKQIDVDSLKSDAIGGAIMGGIFTGAGHVAGAAPRLVQGVAKTADDLKARFKRKEAPADPMEDMPPEDVKTDQEIFAWIKDNEKSTREYLADKWEKFSPDVQGAFGSVENFVKDPEMLREAVTNLKAEHYDKKIKPYVDAAILYGKDVGKRGAAYLAKRKAENQNADAFNEAEASTKYSKMDDEADTQVLQAVAQVIRPELRERMPAKKVKELADAFRNLAANPEEYKHTGVPRVLERLIGHDKPGAPGEPVRTARMKFQELMVTIGHLIGADVDPAVKAFKKREASDTTRLEKIRTVINRHARIEYRMDPKKHQVLMDTIAPRILDKINDAPRTGPAPTQKAVSPEAIMNAARDTLTGRGVEPVATKGAVQSQGLGITSKEAMRDHLRNNEDEEFHNDMSEVFGSEADKAYTDLEDLSPEEMTQDAAFSDAELRDEHGELVNPNDTEDELSTKDLPSHDERVNQTFPDTPEGSAKSVKLIRELESEYNRKNVRVRAFLNDKGEIAHKMENAAHDALDRRALDRAREPDDKRKSGLDNDTGGIFNVVVKQLDAHDRPILNAEGKERTVRQRINIVRLTNETIRSDDSNGHGPHYLRDMVTTGLTSLMNAPHFVRIEDGQGFVTANRAPTKGEWNEDHDHYRNTNGEPTWDLPDSTIVAVSREKGKDGKMKPRYWTWGYLKRLDMPQSKHAKGLRKNVAEAQGPIAREAAIADLSGYHDERAEDRKYADMLTSEAMDFMEENGYDEATVAEALEPVQHALRELRNARKAKPLTEAQLKFREIMARKWKTASAAQRAKWREIREKMDKGREASRLERYLDAAEERVYQQAERMQESEQEKSVDNPDFQSPEIGHRPGYDAETRIPLDKEPAAGPTYPGEDLLDLIAKERAAIEAAPSQSKVKFDYKFRKQTLRMWPELETMDFTSKADRLAVLDKMEKRAQGVAANVEAWRKEFPNATPERQAELKALRAQAMERAADFTESRGKRGLGGTAPAFATPAEKNLQEPTKPHLTAREETGHIVPSSGTPKQTIKNEPTDYRAKPKGKPDLDIMARIRYAMLKGKEAVAEGRAAREAAERPDLIGTFPKDAKTIDTLVAQRRERGNDTDKSMIKLSAIARQWQKQFRLPGDVVVTTHDEMRALSEMSKGKVPLIEAMVGAANQTRHANASHMAIGEKGSVILINAEHLSDDPLQLVPMLAHEFGHALDAQILSTPAGAVMRSALKDRFAQWLAKTHPENLDAFRMAVRRPDSFVNAMTEPAEAVQDRLQQGPLDKWHGNFKEWFAEQTAKYVVQDRRTLTPVEAFFHDFGKTIKEFYNAIADTMQKWLGHDNKHVIPNPDKMFKQFMDAYLDKDRAALQKVFDWAEARTDKATDKEVAARASLDSGAHEIRAYGLNADTKFSNMDVKKGKVTKAQIAEVEAYIHKVLGKKIGVEFIKNLGHAGEFANISGAEMIKLSTMLADPMSVGYHEGLHAFFARLIKADPKAARVLLRAAGSPAIVARLNQLLKGHPKAIEQLTAEGQLKAAARDGKTMTQAEAETEAAEERLAYAYQFSAKGEKGLIQIGPETKTWFDKIKGVLRKIAAVWADDLATAEAVDKAGDILTAFHHGSFANRSTVAAVMRDKFPRGAVEATEAMLPWAAKLANKMLWTASGAVRDANIPAMTRIMDDMFTATDSNVAKPGFVQEKHAVYNRFINKVSDVFEKMPTKERQKIVWDDLHTGQEAKTREGKAIRKILDEVHQYMVDHKVKLVTKDDNGQLKLMPLSKLPNYFPRVYDQEVLRSPEGKEAFLKLLAKHKVPAADALEAYNSVTRYTESGKPGEEDSAIGLTYFTPQLAKRTLGFINDEEMAPFMSTDLFGTLSQYLQRATRRGEYADRFGNIGEEITKARDEAVKQGATDIQLKAFDESVKAMEGTLGAEIDPRLKGVYSGLMTYQNLRLLPLQLFASLIDPLGIMVRGGTLGEATAAFGKGLRDLATLGKASKDDAYEIAKTIGSIDAANAHGLMSEMASSGYMPKLQRGINDKFFRWNGMELWNQRMRAQATVAAVNFIDRHMKRPTEHSARFMKELGLKKGDKLNAKNPDYVRAVNKWVDEAILRPNSAQRPVYMSDPNWMLISHLKQYTYLFQKVIVARVYHEIQHGNYTPAMALAAYVPGMMMADMAKMLLTPGSGDDNARAGWTFMDWFGHGMQRAGLFGPSQYGLEMGTDMKRGGIGIESAAGPTIQQLIQFLQGSMQGRMGLQLEKAIPGYNIIKPAGSGGGGQSTAPATH